MDSGLQVINAANGRRARVFMRAIPIVTEQNKWYDATSPIIAMAISGVDQTTDQSLIQSAREWLTQYWWTNPQNGQNWSWGENGPWGAKGLLRKATSSIGWFGPEDMPWRITDINHFNNTVLERNINTLNVVYSPYAAYNYHTKESGGKHEYEFYPYLKELYNPYNGGYLLDPSLPPLYHYYSHMNQSSLNCYWENLLPLRFVRRD